MSSTKLSRQQKRRLAKEFRKNKWQVTNWQSMKFDRTQHDFASLTDFIDIYANDIYHCVVRDMDDYTHLSIKRHDRLPIHNWQHMQQIKNDICGEEREGVELYPAMSRIIDTSNQYHLWVFYVPVSSIGFKARAVNQ